MTECTCETLIMEAVPLTPFNCAVVEATGEFDAVHEVEGGKIMHPGDQDLPN